jgi:hypothetical protein
MILQNHRRLPVCIFSVKIAALGPWVFKEGIERKQVSNLKELAKTLIISSTRKQKILQTIGVCTESTI